MTLSAEMKRKCLESITENDDPFISLPQAWFVVSWFISTVDELVETRQSNAKISINELNSTLRASKSQLIKNQMIAGRLMRNYKVRRALRFLEAIQRFEEKKQLEEGITEYPSVYHACVRVLNNAPLFYTRVFSDHREMDYLADLFDDHSRQLHFTTYSGTLFLNYTESAYKSLFFHVNYYVTDSAEKADLLEGLEIGWYLFCLKWASFPQRTVTEAFWRSADLSTLCSLPQKQT